MSTGASVPDSVPTPEALLSAAEVAEALRLSLTAVYRLARSGELRSHRLGKGKIRPRGLRIPASAVAEYLDSSRISSGEAA
jgi:excisionase family DNA binding protein